MEKRLTILVSDQLPAFFKPKVSGALHNAEFSNKMFYYFCNCCRLIQLVADESYSSPFFSFFDLSASLAGRFCFLSVS